MRLLRVILLALGSLLALAGIALLIGGAALGWAHNTQRDADGYFTTPTERFVSDRYAITTDEFEILLDSDMPRWTNDRIGEIRLQVSPYSGDAFVGIGARPDVEAYLAGVAHDRLHDLQYRPFKVEYRPMPGDGEPAPPVDQSFWVAQATGPGTQQLTWEIESGTWVIVLMNADGSIGVQSDVQIGGRTDLLPVAIAVLLVGGLLLFLGGTGLILLGAAGSGAATHTAAGAGGESAPMTSFAQGSGRGTPVLLEGTLDEPLSRALWLVKWLLAIPHFIVLAFLWIAFFVLTVVAGVSILFTARYPRGLFDFNVGVMRWTWRVGYYATSAIATDRYPPFSLGHHPEYPAVLDVAYPERLSRGLVLVKWWLLAIPHYLVLAFLVSAPTIAWSASNAPDGWASTGGGGLVGLLVVIAGVILLFKGRYPIGVFNLLMGINRWWFRVLAYAALMTDAYPPFRLDQGAREPQIAEEIAGPLA